MSLPVAQIIRAVSPIIAVAAIGWFAGRWSKEKEIKEINAESDKNKAESAKVIEKMRQEIAEMLKPIEKREENYMVAFALGICAINATNGKHKIDDEQQNELDNLVIGFVGSNLKTQKMEEVCEKFCESPPNLLTVRQMIEEGELKYLMKALDIVVKFMVDLGKGKEKDKKKFLTAWNVVFTEMAEKTITPNETSEKPEEIFEETKHG